MQTKQPQALPTTADDRPPDTPIGILVGLVKEMEPFLDSFGVAHCVIPASNGQKRTWRLNAPAVTDLLTYRYFSENKERPSPRDIGAAMAIVRGELWHTRSEPIIEDTCPVLRTMCKAATIKESWMGSASELLSLLQEVSRDNDLLQNGEELPRNPDAMGIWLSKNVLTLRANGIELYRPRPTAQKRLWAWLRLPQPNDTYGASDGQEPGVASSDNDKQANEMRSSDTCDTLTEKQREILTILKGEKA